MHYHAPRPVDFSDDPHRQKHFQFFAQMDQPHFNICAEVPIGPFREAIRDTDWGVTPALVYLLARTANELRPFRWRIREEGVIEHGAVHPSFTIPTEASEVFSFCTVDYQPEVTAFVAATRIEMAAMQETPSFEDEAGRDDFLFLSAIPWVRFTSISHAMHYTPPDSIPRISWGKFVKSGNELVMPLSVQAHHAVVDGSDIGHYFERITAYLTEPMSWM